MYIQTQVLIYTQIALENHLEAIYTCMHIYIYFHVEKFLQITRQCRGPTSPLSSWEGGEGREREGTEGARKLGAECLSYTSGSSLECERFRVRTLPGNLS